MNLLFPRAKACEGAACPRTSRWWRPDHGLVLNRAWYCSQRCAESALAEHLRALRAPKPVSARAHRLPLGLMLVSSGAITPAQLQSALDAQRRSGRRHLGEWLNELQFADELQVTAALGRQWGCTVLISIPTIRPSTCTLLPLTLLKSIRMAPLEHMPAECKVRMGFAGQLDFSMIRAIESVLACTVELRLLGASLFHEMLREIERRPRNQEIVFTGVAECSEAARIILAYADRLGAQEIRSARIQDYLWARLAAQTGDPVNLLFALEHDKNAEQRSA